MRAAPAARSPRDVVGPTVIRRRAGVEPRPYEGLAERGEVRGDLRQGSSRTPTPTAGGKRTVCRIIYREIIPRPGGGWRNAVGLAKTVTAGRRGRRPLQGGCAAITPAVIPRRAGVGPSPYEGPVETVRAGRRLRRGGRGALVCAGNQT